MTSSNRWQTRKMLSRLHHRLDLSWLSEPFPLAVRRSLLVSGDRDLLAEDVPILANRYEALQATGISGIAWTAAVITPNNDPARVTDLVAAPGVRRMGTWACLRPPPGDFRKLISALPVGRSSYKSA